MGSLLLDEAGTGSWSQSVEAGLTAAAFFLAMRAALASSCTLFRFFFARSPMVDRKDELKYLGSSCKLLLN